MPHNVRLSHETLSHQWPTLRFRVFDRLRSPRPVCPGNVAHIPQYRTPTIHDFPTVKQVFAQEGLQSHNSPIHLYLEVQQRRHKLHLLSATILNMKGVCLLVRRGVRKKSALHPRRFQLATEVPRNETSGPVHLRGPSTSYTV